MSKDPTLTRFAQAIVDQDQARAMKLLAGAPQIAQARLVRDSAEECFVEGIRHMVYAGDTALHLAAACYDADIARALVDAGADVAAANRRGAQPLHYAVDGSPGDARWNPQGGAARSRHVPP